MEKEIKIKVNIVNCKFNINCNRNLTVIVTKINKQLINKEHENTKTRLNLKSKSAVD